jgi:nitrate reductase cytochrome c-type subunit
LTTTVVTPPAIPQFLPTSPDNVEYSMSALTDCLSCHGPGVYLQFPLPPAWDGSVAMSPNNVGIYSVAAGSIQDHTGRSNNECLTCHQPT